MAETSRQRGLRALLNRGTQALLDWFYPRHCHHCGESLHEGRAEMLCRDCLADLVAARISAPVCALCGLPLAGRPAPGTLCMRCRAEQRNFDLARALFAYRGPGRSLIHCYKFDGAYFLGPKVLRNLLRRGWLPADVADVDATLPVPLHPRRRRQRGYDQALLLAGALARELDCRLVRGALARTRYTSQQALLPASRRWDNVRGAFAVRKPEAVRGRCLLLVDDVMTSGTTADECAKVLKKAGACEVRVFTLARTIP
jgi:ComF family protein